MFPDYLLVHPQNFSILIHRILNIWLVPIPKAGKGLEKEA